MTHPRLALDEMFQPSIAEQLNERGHDVLAVAATAGWSGMPDEHILVLATEQQRVLVTENVRDLEHVRLQWLAEDRLCVGLLYTNRQRFPREARWLGRIIAALDERLTHERLPAPGQVDWLS